MKKLLSVYMLAILLILSVSQTFSESLEGSINDPTWDGENIPKEQLCNKFGGINPVSPEIRITGIPEGTEAIVLKFNDESISRMNRGGHGIVAKLIEPGVSELIFPSVPGHTLDLQEGILMVKPHSAPRWDKAGAYLPPCSGGTRNRYSVTIEPSKIKNLKKNKFKRITNIKIKLGTY